MPDACVDFLQWSLPRLGRRWPGYRKVHRQVCRRVRRRITELGLDGFAAYRDRLSADPAEWRVLESLTNITISRFYRDREVFDGLFREVLPALGRPRVWSAGAAGGEEAYTIAVGWRMAGRPPLEILGTDVDEAMLTRARSGCYSPGSLRDLPDAWRSAFTHDLCLREEFRAGVRFAHHDVREPPPIVADLILCRYLAFTYFDERTQLQVARSLAGALRRGGALVLGTHERVPPAIEELEPWPGLRCTWVRTEG
jgi:chemotaxis protein methyltransferase CheR